MTDQSAAEGGLSVRWKHLVESVGAPADAIDRLLIRHGEPHRRYHTAKHVLALLRHLDSLDQTSDPAPRLAAFYHDAIYETSNLSAMGSNEELSARLAESELALCDPVLVGRVAALIRATEGHALIADSAASIFLDADLAILGADAATYATYATHIREEYGHVPDPEFRSARSAVLEGLLNREMLYYSPQGRELWEQVARRNMTAELANLST